MKTKKIILISVVAFFVIVSGCNKKEPDKTILGTWEIVADAMYPNQINKRDTGTRYQFLPNGTFLIFIDTKMKGEIYGGATRIGSYTIDSDYLEYKLEFSTNRYKISFSKDQLILSRDPMHLPGPGNSDLLYYTNIIILKKISD